jgi:hypothetical protein
MAQVLEAQTPPTLVNTWFLDIPLLLELSVTFSPSQPHGQPQELQES